MRIIAGTHRGRRIAAPKGAHTRPTSDRTREALFSIVGPVADATVLDLFAGSGALGLEALSRGARRCVFADTDAAACRVVQQNLAHLGLEAAIVLRRDAVSVLRAEATAGRAYDLILADPPYGDWTTLEARFAAAVTPVLAPDGLLVVETDAAVEPELPLDRTTTRRYGSARLTVFAHP